MVMTRVFAEEVWRVGVCGKLRAYIENICSVGLMCELGESMADNELDREFLQKQKARLEELRKELGGMAEGMAEDNRDRAEAEGDFTEHDSGDMSQSLFTREMDATVGQVMEGRLGVVERALQKIEEGTYGFSDVSGEPIVRGRLEAMPEAIYRVDEQQDFENGRRYRQEINEDSQPPLS